MIEEIITHYEKWYAAFHNYVRHHDGSREQAKDAFQEGVFSTLRALKNGSDEPRNTQAYVFVAAKRAFWAALKRNRLLDQGLIEAGEGHWFSQSTSPAHSDNQLQAKEVLEACLNALEGKAKEILTLTVEGFNDKQIAEKMEVAVDYVKVARCKARAKIKRLFGNEGFAYLLVLFIVFNFA